MVYSLAAVNTNTEELTSFKKTIGFKVQQNYDQHNNSIFTLQTDTKDNRESITTLQTKQESIASRVAKAEDQMRSIK